MSVHDEFGKVELFEDLWNSLPEACRERYEKSGAMTFFYRGFDANQELARQALRIKELEKALLELIDKYENTLEDGRERIISLGGKCDTFAMMTVNDGQLIKSKTLLSTPAITTHLDDYVMSKLEIVDQHHVIYCNKIKNWKSDPLYRLKGSNK